MNPAFWERVKDVYGEALELPPEQRLAYVDSATNDTDLRGEVLRLLKEESQMEGFLKPIPILGEIADRALTGSTFEPGQLVAARYRIERHIKTGGMGEVYEAFDSRLNLRIAIKTLLPEIAGDPQSMNRFRREVAIARNVTHPNVCRVFDIGEHDKGDGRPPIAFLTMEYLDGESLSERLRRTGPMTCDQALPLVSQMADALDAAHRVGVVHRDFKPGNVMLVASEAGGERAVVTDFGIARNIRPAAEGNSTTGSMIGTPAYMAPEQWTGETLGPTTDLYALGIVMLEMLTGERIVGRQLPNDKWKRVIDACLQRDPGARPRSAREVSAALARRPKKMWMGVLAAALFLSLFAAAFRYIQREWPKTSASGAKHVAVLPLRAASAELQVFADGLVEAITQQLSQYEGINGAMMIVPAREVPRGMNSAADAKKQFGPAFAVEGSLQFEENRLRLLFAVIDTQTMRQVDSVTVQGTRDKGFALQDSAVSKLANILAMRVQPKRAAELNSISPMDPEAYDYYLQARGYLQRTDRLTDVESAITLLRRAASATPKDALVRAALGEAYWYKYERTSKSEWIKLAQEECRQALSLNPDAAEPHITMGRVLVGTGEPQKAISEFQKALAIEPRSPEAYQAMGRAYFDIKDYPTAEATYRKAIELRSRDWRGYRELGLFYHRRSEYLKAIEQFNKVVALSPDNPGAYNNLGVFYGKLENRTMAREMFQKALEIDPGWISSLNNLTKILFDEGRVDEALRRWEKSVEKNPNSYEYWGNLGSAYRKAGRHKDADRAFNEGVRLTSDALRVNPTSRELRSFRAHFLAPLGRRDEALHDIEKAGSLSGSDAEMLIRDAVTLMDLGRPDRAETLVQAALKLNYPPDALVRNAILRPLYEKIRAR